MNSRTPVPDTVTLRHHSRNALGVLAGQIRGERCTGQLRSRSAA